MTSPRTRATPRAKTPPANEELAAARARAARALLIVGLAAVAIILGLVWASEQNAGVETPAPGTDGVLTPEAGSAGSAVPDPGQWDTAAESALAILPMTRLPDAAAQPQTLAPAGPPVIAVPTATRANAVGLGEGFAPTPEGAIGQLAALDVVALADLNPTTYNDAYRSISLPGAPDPGFTPLGAQVAKTYAAVVLGGSDSSPIASRWQLAGAQVKGVTNGGRSVTVCVAGELQAAQASSTESGTGDCQSMRFTGSDWRIAPGPAAAPAPITWPGSPSFVRAGYHPTTGGTS